MPPPGKYWRRITLAAALALVIDGVVACHGRKHNF
jgi:hypothetical protein